MPALGEIGRRRFLFALSGLGVNALIGACNISNQEPAPNPTSASSTATAELPKPPKNPTVTPEPIKAAPALPTATRTPRIGPLPTVDIPELRKVPAISSTPRPTPRPTETTIPIEASALKFSWEVNALIPEQQPNYLFVFALLADTDGYMFYHNPDGKPTALKLDTKEAMWIWDKKGYVITGDKVGRFNQNRYQPDSDNLYILGEDKEIYTIAAKTGEVKWKTNLSQEEKDSLSEVKSLHGVVYLTFYSIKTDSRQTATYDKSNGRLLWKKPIWLSYNSRGQTLIADTRYIDWQTGETIYNIAKQEEGVPDSVFWQNGFGAFEHFFLIAKRENSVLLVLDFLTGKKLWQQDLPNKLGDFQIVGFGSNGKRVYVQDRRGEKDSGMLYAFDFLARKMLWQKPVPRNNIHTLEHEGTTYVAMPEVERRKLAAIDSETGKLKWETDKLPPSDTFSGQIMSIYQNTGLIIAELARKPSEPVYIKHAYIGFELSNGKQIWRYDERDKETYGQIILGRYFFREDGGKLKILDLQTGKLIPHDLANTRPFTTINRNELLLISGEYGKVGRIIAAKLT